MTTTSSTSSIAGQVNQTASGQTYITGTVSGLDTETLIESAVATKTAAATALDTQVSTDGSRITAYQQIQSYMNALESSLLALNSATNSTGLSATGASGTPGSAFASKSVSYTTSDGSSATSLLSVTADSTAATGTHRIIVQQVAQAMQVTGTAQTSDTTALGYTGSFALNLDGNSASTINVTSGMSMEDVENAINATTSTSGVSADILQSSSGYELVLAGSSTDQQINVSGVTGDDVLTGIGVTNAGGGFATVSQVAQGAQISLDGATVTSTTNSFTNVLTGLDIDVTNAAPSTTITATLGNDTSDVETAINSVITNYNTLRDYLAAEQTVNSDGSINSDQYLYNDPIVNDSAQALSSILTSLSGSGTINSLASIGITLDSDNHLVVSNQTALTNALDNNYSSVSALFQTQATSTDANLSVVTNTTSLSTGSLSIAITTDGSGTITGASANGDASAFTISGDELVGAAGTPYAGMTLKYTGTNSTTATMSFTPGMADQLTNTLDGYANSDTGIIATQITAVQSNDTTLTAESTQIKSDAANYEQTLIDKYAQMETAISTADTLKSQILAILNSTRNSD
jgi:flagellar hook-associated protein 2